MNFAICPQARLSITPSLLGWSYAEQAIAKMDTESKCVQAALRRFSVNYAGGVALQLRSMNSSCDGITSRHFRIASRTPSRKE